MKKVIKVLYNGIGYEKCSRGNMFGLFFKAINYTQWYQWTSALFDGGEVYPWHGKFELKNHFETLYL